VIEKKYQTFSKRFFAMIIDCLIFIPFFIIADYLIYEKKTSVLWVDLCQAILWTAYYIVGHGKYGQTIGKRVMKVKVLNLTETKVIGYKKAFYRESVGFFAYLLAIIYLLFSYGEINVADTHKLELYENLTLIFSIGWCVIELGTMLTNKKRRAIHDYIGSSVVVNLKYV